MQTELLASMRQQPDDPLSKLLLGVYASAHPALAGGQPPLTRQMSDAFFEFLVFAADQLWGTDAQPTQPAKDSFAQALADAYPGYSADQQAFISHMPACWTALRAAWPTLSAEDQTAYKQL
jgi:hypothetical protein